MGSAAPSSLLLSRVHSWSLTEAWLLRRLAAMRAVTFRPRGFSPPRRFPPRGGCGLVASRSRPGGSTRFRRSNEPLPRAVTPFEVFPSPAAGPRHRGRCPPVVTLGHRTRSRSPPGLPCDVRSLRAPPPSLTRSPSPRRRASRQTVTCLAFVAASSRRRPRAPHVAMPRSVRARRGSVSLPRSVRGASPPDPKVQGVAAAWGSHAEPLAPSHPEGSP